MRMGVTGATGFLGSEVVRRCRIAGHDAVALTRRADDRPGAINIGELDGRPIDSDSLRDLDAVVHCAARTHVLNDYSSDPLAAYRRINVSGTQALLAAASKAGVKRFVFVSSVKAVGERSARGVPLRYDTPPQPEDAYGVTKLEAERCVRAFCPANGMEWVIVRPPLVFGEGVKANFARIIGAVRSGIPLPFAAVDNRRSLVDVVNLAAAIVSAAVQENVAGKTFMIADVAISTPQLMRCIAQAAKVPSRLFPVPKPVLRFAGGVTGRSRDIERLCGSLEIDASPAHAILGSPIRSFDGGLRATVEAYEGQTPNKDVEA